MEPKTKILFVCTHNSARSQMAEALLNDLAGDRFEATSAGIDPGVVNPLAAEVMKEVGIDISGNGTKMVFDVYRAGRTFHYVIGVCDASAMERCPIFPGITTRLDWSFPDPSAFTGTTEERLALTRNVRDTIAAKIREFVDADKNRSEQ
jgi:arsenate reductase (thioredoxin)